MKNNELPTCRFELITPSDALQILETQNIKNRRLKIWRCESLAAAMRRGEWVTTHQGISFTKSGRLLDGQHRLRAVVLSKISVWMLVVRGLSDDAFKVIDVGSKRSIEDTTGLSKKTAEACKHISTIVFGGGATAQQVLDVAASGAAEIHEKLLTYSNSTKACFTTAAVRTAAVALVMDGHPDHLVFKTYADTAAMRFDELPAVAKSFIKQVSDKKIISSGAGSGDLLARALKYLNPQNAGILKIQISPAEISSGYEYTRDVIKRAMS